ncbi:MAG TPA: Vms1/Ankzf1 family peptidyl-tRNA hydrolase [Methanothrix sp.]|nr:Vms1/Ankzf1 family peptidyl-tRNA hydrolase [Methanothrix sp.]
MGDRLVDLFGKRKLEDRLQELESSRSKLQGEKEELLRALEKRDEKIRKLSSAYQEANLALKASEQRAAPAQTSSQSQSGNPPGSEAQKPIGTKLTRREMQKILKRLESCRSPEDDLLSAFLPDSEGLPEEAAKVASAVNSARGWIILEAPWLFTLLFVPPFPVKEGVSGTGSVFQLEPLREMIETPVLVVSAHAGDTFLGVSFGKDSFEVQEFVESQVKEKHSKGGWSQKRFERLRDEDIKNHVDAVLVKLAALMSKYGSVVRFAVMGGDTSILKQVTPAVGLPIVERRLERHDERRIEKLLDEVYGFIRYRV